MSLVTQEMSKNRNNERLPTGVTNVDGVCATEMNWDRADEGNVWPGGSSCRSSGESAGEGRVG